MLRLIRITHKSNNVYHPLYIRDNYYCLRYSYINIEHFVKDMHLTCNVFGI